MQRLLFFASVLRRWPSASFLLRTPPRASCSMFPPIDLSPFNNLDVLDTSHLRATLGAMLVGGFICIL